jgi:hypothetical protein
VRGELLLVRGRTGPGAASPRQPGQTMGHDGTNTTEITRSDVGDFPPVASRAYPHRFGGAIGVTQSTVRHPTHTPIPRW